MITKMIDQIINKFKETEFRSSGASCTIPILSRFSPDEEAVMRSVLSSWIQDCFIEELKQVAELKAKIMVYEEVIKKSNFAPFVKQIDKEGAE